MSFQTQDQFSVVLNAEGRKVGDFDEQRDWSGVRGGERFSDDPTKYKDAKEACTWIPGHLFPSLQWQLASGYRDQETALTGSKSWRGLYGPSQSISRRTIPSTSSNRAKVWIWIRRVGTPGTMTVELRTNSADTPTSTVLKSTTITIADVTDTVSVLHGFTWASVQAVTSGTTYHILLVEMMQITTKIIGKLQ